MGNRKFKLSEMIPNAWFYKLKAMGTKKHNPPPPPQAPPQKEPPFSMPHHDSLSQSRKSYHFTRDLNPKSSDLLLFPPPDPPRKSSKLKRRPTTTTTTKRRPTSIPTSTSTTKSSSSSSSHGDETCVVIDVDKKSLGRKTEDSVSTLLRLPPIKTERSKFNDLVDEIGGDVEAIDAPIKQKKNESLSVKVAREEGKPMASSVFKEQGIRPVRRFPTGSPRFRIRINSPRIARRAQVNSSKGSISRKSISSDSLAVVKSSFDPKRDFRDSMVEMIVENNIRASKDLEELLASYLSLNSDEYHDVIIQVFKQIWFDLNNIRRVREVVA